MSLPRKLPPPLGWMLELLASWQEEEPLAVLMRLNGNRQSEQKAHLRPADRALLGRLLDMLKEWLSRNGSDGPTDLDDQSSDRSQDRSEDDQTEATDDRTGSEDSPPGPVLSDGPPPDLNELERGILAVLRAANRPLCGKAIAARLERKHSGWFKGRLARLHALGYIDLAEDGFVVTARGRSV